MKQILLLLYVTYVIAHSHHHHRRHEILENEETAKTREMCESEDCRNIAMMIKTSMDLSVNPCNDFYAFTCGNYAKTHPLEPNQKVRSEWTVLQKKVNSEVKKILKEESKDDDVEAIKLARRWYRACMDTDGMDKRGLEPLISLLKELGGWPLITKKGDWEKKNIHWQDINHVYARITGRNAFHKIESFDDSVIMIQYPAFPEDSWRISPDTNWKEDHDEGGQLEPTEEEKGNEEGGVEENKEEKKESPKSRQEKLRRKYRNEKSRYKHHMKSKHSRRKLTKDGTEELDEEEGMKIVRYEYFISTVARALADEEGVKLCGDDFREDLTELIQFQRRLMTVSNYYDEDEMTIDEFQKWYDGLKHKNDKSQMNWAQELKDLFKEADVKVDTNSVKATIPSKYLKELSRLLDETPERAIANYIHWKFISTVLRALTTDMRQLSKTWFHTSPEEANMAEEQSRMTICVESAQMNNIVAHEYVKRFFNDEVVDIAKDIITDVQKEVEKQVKDSDWLTSKDKTFVLDKLNNMEKHIGYPEWYKNETAVRRQLDGLEIGESYFENFISYTKYAEIKEVRKTFGIEGKDPNWDLSDPVTVNAFFLFERNSVVITAADFQFPMFSLNRLAVLQYAIIGEIMGHEVNHGFDTSGMFYDKTGTWISPKTDMKEKYEERVNCFINQFNKYGKEVFGMENYGKKTKGENIADTMGLQAVYKAYKRKADESAISQMVLPGLENYNDDQLFFITFGSLWCENIDPKFDLFRAKSEPHSTAPIRIIGTLSNSEDFAKTFQCPIGSPMNPEKKCNIWK